MWPWGHIGLAYLLYHRHVERTQAIDDARQRLLLLVLGSNLPDLIDKPLAWYLSLLPSGRSLAHSLFVAIALTVAVAVLVSRSSLGRSWGALVVGYWSHLVGDVLFSLLVDTRDGLAFLTYPLTRVSGGSSGGAGQYLDSFWAGLVRATTGDVTVVVAFDIAQILLFISAALLWWVRGRPGFSWSSA